MPAKSGFAAVWSTFVRGNGHGYIVLSNTPTITEAMDQCTSFGNSTFKSYLATFESKQEWDFIKNNIYNYQTAWVSGKDLEGNGNYSYSSGPATNQPLFNMYTGQCFEVYIPSIGTNGGSITINNLTQFNISTINITFFNPTKQLSKSCHITQTDKSSVTCIVPRLSGFHDVTVQDASGTSSTHYAWQPYPPFIKAVYPPSPTAKGLVTLIGNNFGDDTDNTVSVSVSTSNIPCIISFASSNQIICQLLTPLVGETKLLPISISVDQVYTQTYKPHIYSILMQYSFSIVCEDRFFSTILFGGDYERVNRLMIDKCPSKGAPSRLYYSGIDPKVKPSDNIPFNIHNGKVVPFDTKNVKYYTPLITFYTNDTPIIDNITSIIPGQPSQVTINGNHFGKDGSYGYEPLLDCSSSIDRDKQLNTTVMMNSTLILSTSQTISVIVNFTTGIQSIREISHDKSIVRSMSMDVVSWEQVNQTQHKQTSYIETVFIGSIHNQSTRFNVTVVQFQDTNTSTFLGEDIQVSSNSIKYTIKTIDWVWSSPINTLQVIFHSRSDSVEYDDCGRMKIGNDVSPGDQIIWTRVQVGRTLLNCKIASRMIIDNSTIMPSKVTILPDDPLSQQTDKQGFNVLTTFHIPRFSHSVELDPVFNAVILDDDSALPYECIETT
ncbi:hypothetical protein DFA_03146 [Cavenderia fasciculata]|uniref:IPT/TIG domain-containing protein n=1 Tax=Cavenderia fasciculata TaxID=261658 RepID=F4PGR7_CACFS|nr:uncharacterized protein DFA_03146 [Cavenderia fasciculata]EGG24901.1 hypothetical protein DFA_03146 [Cavenderia fasciculata]|eukprot:XP_004362752.1 hypothetical protein DFA_03146 [Cavenderia fasciculata]